MSSGLRCFLPDRNAAVECGAEAMTVASVGVRRKTVADLGHAACRTARQPLQSGRHMARRQDRRIRPGSGRRAPSEHPAQGVK